MIDFDFVNCVVSSEFNKFLAAHALVELALSSSPETKMISKKRKRRRKAEEDLLKQAAFYSSFNNKRKKPISDYVYF